MGKDDYLLLTAVRRRGLAVYGLDGTTLHVADTPENVAHFGRPGSRHGEGAGYPQLRLVAESARLVGREHAENVAAEYLREVR